jgi:hypothetical protein
MLRLIEIGLFASPFAAFLAWRLLAGSQVASRNVIGVALAALVAISAGLVWFGLDRRLAPEGRYVPAEWSHGRIVPGHSAAE